MTLRAWLKNYGSYTDDLLDKEILIECPNGLLVTPVIFLKKKEMYGPNTHENVEALVIATNRV